MTARFRLLTVIAATAALAGCKSSGNIVVDQGVGITALRTTCPAVGIPDYTGDITLFRGAARTADAIDVVAAMTNVRTTCDDTGAKVYAVATFDVLARRSNTERCAHRADPYFSTVLRGGSAVVSKRVGTVTVTFADGQEPGAGHRRRRRLYRPGRGDPAARHRRSHHRERSAGEQDAAVDPLTLPEVRSALSRANFELLVGFQLSEAQLAYNATR